MSRLSLIALFVSVTISSAITSSANEISYVVGWSDLPRQTKLDGWTLYCRDARLVVYTDIDHKDINLEEEIIKLATNCAIQSAARIGISSIISNPSSYVSDFSANFLSCVGDGAMKKSRILNIRTSEETGEWGSCK